jgi:hypothetical protein
MKTQQATPILRYNRLSERDQAPETATGATRRTSRLNEAVTWGILSICLVGWAVVGLFLWIPRVLRAVLAFSVALVHSTLTETTAEPAGRSLRSAANFYRRGFVSAVESIRPPSPEEAEAHEDGPGATGSVRSAPIIRETAWAIFVWYVAVWSTGLLQGTPVDPAAVPWSDLWSGAGDAVASIPNLFRNLFRG